MDLKVLESLGKFKLKAWKRGIFNINTKSAYTEYSGNQDDKYVQYWLGTPVGKQLQGKLGIGEIELVQFQVDMMRKKIMNIYFSPLPLYHPEEWSARSSTEMLSISSLQMDAVFSGQPKDVTIKIQDRIVRISLL